MNEEAFNTILKVKRAAYLRHSDYAGYLHTHVVIPHAFNVPNVYLHNNYLTLNDEERQFLIEKLLAKEAEHG